jgi:SPP1 gp7 family putative phage head morphogenesis protein
VAERAEARRADRVNARRETRRQRDAFEKVRDSERDYARRLRKIASHVGDIVEAFDPEDPGFTAAVTRALDSYAELIKPWAEAVGKRMVAETARRDELAWDRYSRMMGVELRRQIQGAPVGTVARQIQERQVDLITSLPREAAIRVQEIAQGSLYTGERSSVLRDEIMKSGDICKTRATLIARTETARAATAFTHARAVHVGSDGYTWRTAHDRDVRLTHKRMDGQFIRWDSPPVVDPGKPPYHAGGTYNCFTGSTTVGLESGVRRVFRSRYRGPLIVLIVKNAAIEVTPNHPILTRRGWVPAATLNVGDDVAEVLHECSHVLTDGDVENKLVTFDQLYESFATDGCSGAAISNFYGDRVIDDKVEIALTERDLPIYTQSSRRERVSYDVVTDPHSGVCGSRVVGRDPAIFESALAGGDQFCFSPFGADRVSHDLASLGLRPNTFPGLQHESSYDERVKAELMPEGRTSFTGHVSAHDLSLHDRIRVAVHRRNASASDDAPYKTAIEAERAAKFSDSFTGHVPGIDFHPVQRRDRRWFEGPVFTIETFTGYYHVGNGTTAKNCRCWAEPVFPTTDL